MITSFYCKALRVDVHSSTGANMGSFVIVQKALALS